MSENSIFPSDFAFLFEDLEHPKGRVILVKNAPKVLSSKGKDWLFCKVTDDFMFSYAIRVNDFLTVDANIKAALGDFVVVKKDDEYYLRIYSGIEINEISSKNVYASNSDEIAGAVVSCDRFVG